jgi:Sec-independent protein translocase protein TatA
VSRVSRVLIQDGAKQIAEVKEATNGMKEELVRSTAKASKAEGKAEEAKEQIQRTKAETQRLK